MRPSRPYRKRRPPSREPVWNLSPQPQQAPLRIHPQLRSIFERIKVPAPQPFQADPFQVEALEMLDDSDVLVTAPTGAGKTYIAVEAIRKVFQSGGHCWYASPLKALSNSKYEEFSELFGGSEVGIVTGDRKENVHAPIIVGTTEILRNQLYDTMYRGEDLGVDLVVLDEAHFLGDEDRGVVWEEVLIYLPARVRLLLLSATIRNAQEICGWLEWLRGTPCTWVAAWERPVPLYPLFLFPTGELTPLGNRRGLFAKIRTIDRRAFPKGDFPDIQRILNVLRQCKLLPAIFFLKSRADCERAIFQCHPVSQAEGLVDAETYRERVNDLLDEWPFLRRHQHLAVLKYARVGAHHGGQLPHWKLLLEKLMQEGLLEAIFSTSTVAAGVNFPARTAVVFQSDRFNGREFVELRATDLLQMTGRAGRRGMDEIGFVLVMPGPHQDPQLLHDLLKSPPDAITSQIRINFSMVLNLLLSHSPEEIRSLFSACLATYQNLHRETHLTEEFEAASRELGEWLPEAACGSLERLAEVRSQYTLVLEQTRKARSLLKHHAGRSQLLQQILPGRMLIGQRGTPYVAVASPDVQEQTVEAVRLVAPLRRRKGRVRTYRLCLQRIRQVGRKLETLPSLKDFHQWEKLLPGKGESPQDPTRTGNEAEEWLPVTNAARELTGLIAARTQLPCETCKLFGPCQKATDHPFSAALQQYFSRRSLVNSIQDQLWRSFQLHHRILQEEGYVAEDGRLTEDGLWASKLRLDQPLLISEGIRQGVFPLGDPPLLAALIAPFVMDRERQGDIQLSSLVWKYPDVAKPFFRMLQSLQRLRERLQQDGFATPPLPFWAVVTVYYWALGEDWDKVRQISSMDEGDLAMVILRTADHLRQIESLGETHPQLAASARRAIGLILREPVLMADVGG